MAQSRRVAQCSVTCITDHVRLECQQEPGPGSAEQDAVVASLLRLRCTSVAPRQLSGLHRFKKSKCPNNKEKQAWPNRTTLCLKIVMGMGRRLGGGFGTI